MSSCDNEANGLQPEEKRRRVDAAQTGSGSDRCDVILRSEWSEPAVRSRLRAEFEAASPYPHAVMRPFLDHAGFCAVREELQKLDATEKETDLFRFFQTSDIAPRGEKGVGSLAALTRLFGSLEFRELCAEITQCGELTDRVDLSSQVYPRGSHLLCHDDVIGTRKVSFILYLTDPEEDWAPEEGGGLELYPSAPGAPRGTPHVEPSKELLPFANSLAFFVVEPGVSFHAVREVRGARARVSLQGWLHAPSLEQTKAFEDRGLATLQQLLANPPRISLEAPKESLTSEGNEQKGLSKEDVAILGRWIAAEYLSADQLEAVAERFVDSSYAVLKHFLRADLAERISAALADADASDGFQANVEDCPAPAYRIGANDGWELIGPPHLRRHLRYRSASSGDGDRGGAATAPAPGEGSGSSSSGAAIQESSPHQRLGMALQEVKSLFQHPAFGRWLQACVHLEPHGQGRLEIRRFRPGLDYTVAARAEASKEDCAELDATLAFVGMQEGAEEAWNSEEVGGFESYLAADEDKVESVETQEVYRGGDADGPLVNIPAAFNQLSLVMRDDQTLRFVKYLSRDAPSTRADVAACYIVDAPEGGSEDESDVSDAPTSPETTAPHAAR